MDQTTIRETLGDALVDDFLAAGARAGDSYLPGDENLAFGFIQRVLARLQQAGTSRGLLFPKFDAAYNRYFDYVDGDGTIRVLPIDALPVPADAFIEQDVGDPDQTYYRLAPGVPEALVWGFLAAVAARKRRPG